MTATIITIFDYGAGNMHSLVKALGAGDEVEVRLQSDPIAALDTDMLVLPGVGAFSNAAARLASGAGAMRNAIVAGLPTLCICLGMQLLFDASDEGPGAGLGVIPGRVRRLRARSVPQIGWNEVESGDHRQQMDSRFRGNDGAFASMTTCVPHIAYFANSYVCEPDNEDCIVAYSTHERDRFASVVTVANTVGVQFHPEKSSQAGVRFVRDFVEGVIR
ncbi:MAG: imidazole glycerol phosphate synthase subunit HisH [Gemmatimonadaceae bacterium]